MKIFLVLIILGGLVMLIAAFSNKDFRKNLMNELRNDLNRPKRGPIGRFWNGVKNPGGLRTASTNRSGRRRK